MENTINTELEDQNVVEEVAETEANTELAEAECEHRYEPSKTLTGAFLGAMAVVSVVACKTVYKKVLKPAGKWVVAKAKNVKAKIQEKKAAKKNSKEYVVDVDDDPEE